jgi:thiol-disulfide isomerase/thioredoxin
MHRRADEVLDKSGRFVLDQLISTLLLQGMFLISCKFFNMRKIVTVGIVLMMVMQVQSHGQGHQVEVLIRDLPDRMVYLSLFDKDEYLPVDSVEAVNGSFYFFKGDHQPRGMYRIDFRKPDQSGGQDGAGFIEFIWAEESFMIYADYSDLAGSASFGNSAENRLMGEYREYEELYERKMAALYSLIDRYPGEDAFYRDAVAHFLELQEERDAFIVAIAQSNPDLFVSRLIDAYRSVLMPKDLKGQQRRDFLKIHFFDKAPIDDPKLLHAPVYNHKIIEYLMLYRSQELSFSDQEDAFTEAVDIIMANVSGDPDLRTFAVEYLLEGFRSFGMERVETYIVDTYVDETCVTDAVELAQQRVEGYRKMEEGQIAEDILIRSADRRMVRLSEVDADYTLVLFWATYCEHCVQMMPDLRDWYLNEKPDNMEVFTVSIDTSRMEWDRFLRAFESPWISTHEPMGWEGKSAGDYNVYATPTMFLLDRQRRIVARPYTLRELRRDLRKIE